MKMGPGSARAIALACAAILSAPVLAQQTPSTQDVSETSLQKEQAQDALLQKAVLMLEQKRADDAIRSALNPLIAEFESQYSADPRRIYSVRTPAEALLYMASHATAVDSDDTRQDAIALGPTYGYAYYTKAYALIELGNIDQAKHALDKALQLSPSNPQFLAELGHYYQIAKDWKAMLATYEKAAEWSLLASPDELRDLEHARALRGQGYALIELNRLEDAKARFLESLDLQPGNRIAESELEYIRRLDAGTPGNQKRD